MSKLKLIEHLIDVKNISGSIRPAPHGIKDLKSSIEGVPFDVHIPSMSGVISSKNLLGGVLKLAKQLGGLSKVGNFKQVFGEVARLTGAGDLNAIEQRLESVDPESLSRSVGVGQLQEAVGEVVTLTASLTGR